MAETALPDIIVVGGGSAGCAMAGRLAENPNISVLLIEAGGDKADMHTRVPAMVSRLVMNPRYDWMLPVEPDASVKGRADFWPAGKWLGGGSSINGMMYIRGNAHDYDHWAQLGATGWSYDDVLPYFRRMENNPREGRFHGKDGPMRVSESRLRYSVTDRWIESATHAGVPRCADLNGDGRVAEGVDHVQMSQTGGRRWSSADGYIRNGKHGGRLTVMARTSVRRIIVENGRACGVEIMEAGGAVRTIRARRGVVLSAGAMGSPKLLMLSGIGPAAHLREQGLEVVRDAPGVGTNLQDHVGLNIAWKIRGVSLNSEIRGLGLAKAGLEYLVRKTGMLTTAIAHAQAMIYTRPGLPAPNIQLAFSPFAFEVGANGERFLPPESSVSMLVCALHPAARGTLLLRSPDPEASPLIRHRLLGEDDEDLEQIVEGIEIARRIMAQAPLADEVVAEMKPGADIKGDALRDFVRTVAISCFHQVGTCRMGTDAMAVVDPSLRVHGVDGLWVADCSVAPSLVGANTNATAIMIGDKGADHVLAALGMGRG
ncbi:MAG: FAD-binding protein [Sphingomonadales bacterium]|nr:MAG: FAD-binding protein [Sphingomonadales bacterium]TNF03422.1 MAG: FAD-binding protein [Sphingomonadales bacterium]